MALCSWDQIAKDTHYTLCNKEDGKMWFKFFLIRYFLSLKSARDFVCKSLTEVVRYSPFNRCSLHILLRETAASRTRLFLPRGKAKSRPVASQLCWEVLGLAKPLFIMFVEITGILCAFSRHYFSCFPS